MKLEESALKILHLPKYAAHKGGMDGLIRLHAKNGDRICSLLRNRNLAGEGFHGSIPFKLQKSSLARIERFSDENDVSIYYNNWGSDLFSSHDRSRIKVGYIHNHFPRFDHYINYYSKFVDGFLTVNPVTNTRIRELLRDSHPKQNIQLLPLPINPPNELPSPPKQNIIGLVGRINYEQKRYDRLPRFAALLKQKYPHLKIEVLGDGPLKDSISSLLMEDKQVRFLEWARNKDYWEIIARWKYVLFLSDYEGLPISLLEALHAGCIPIYPDFHKGQPQGLPLRLYDKGNLKSAIECLGLKELETNWSGNHLTPTHYLNCFKNAIDNLSHCRKSTIPLSIFDQSISYNKRYKTLTGSSPNS